MSPEVICLDCRKKKEHHALGLCGTCYTRQWCKANPEGIKAINHRYYKSHKEIHAARCRAYYERHREEKAAYDRKYQKAHRQKIAARRKARKEERAAQNRDWRHKNPERVVAATARKKARKASVPDTLTTAETKQLLEIGQAIYPGKELHLDHIVPLSKGGGTTLANCHYILGSLNMSKYNTLPQDVYRQEELPWLNP